MDLKEYIEKQMNKTKVKNVKGKYKVPKSYESWLEYWERNTGKRSTGCEKDGCNKTNDIVGGHVYKQGDNENIYLVPICHVHNSNDYENYYNVPSDKLLLVPKEDLERAILKEWWEEITKSQNI